MLNLLLKQKFNGKNAMFIRNFSSRSSEIKQLMNQYSNITPKILSCADRKLLFEEINPLAILKQKISKFYKQNGNFEIFDDISPIVSKEQNFDDLLTPLDHPSRKKSESYYLNENQLLRCHTSAHQIQLLKQNINSFCVFGDVYRRDEIDQTHYPVFHQMESVKMFNNSQLPEQADQKIDFIVKDLQNTLEKLIKELFGNVQMRWVPAYFPFTNPSLELEIYFKDDWLEVLGCGVIERGVLDKAGKSQIEYGWAAGFGLERFAMLLFDIPDIRLFWSQDPRFYNQFISKEVVKFQVFSKYPLCYKDLTFWINDIEKFEENDLFELIRDVAGDLIEKVECVDVFVNKKSGKTSKCFRIFYRSLERTLVNQEIDELQFKIRELVKNKLDIQLR